MQIASPHPHSTPAHAVTETETAVWVMIVVLLGVLSFAVFSLLDKLTG